MYILNAPLVGSSLMDKNLVILFIVAFAIRILLIIYGEWHDQNYNLKYTDIDYTVFTDAAIHVSRKESPYDRATYRYTPLLAYILLPNVHIHRCFGKILFSIADIVLSYLVYSILTMRGVAETTALLSTALWLLNPLPVVVSSRGNAESILACMVVGTIYLIMKKKNLSAAIVFAVAVHFKTYPIIYAPSIYLLINEQYSWRLPKAKSKVKHVLNLLRPNDISILFAIVGASVTGGLVFLFYNIYGQVFLDETYWYHVTRKDIQHNFSIYFYPLRLAQEMEPFISTIIGLSAFIPQMAASAVLCYKFYADLPFCWFITTFAFVTFNKVCTSQYFLWYLCLLPLVIPGLSMSVTDASVTFLVWLTAQGIWFTPAYLYEFHQYDILGIVWAASLYFFWINIWCMWKFMKSYKYSPLFDGSGEIYQLKIKPNTASKNK